MHYRSIYRGVVRMALAADPAFATFTVLSAWAQNIDEKTLPVLAVATPSEAKDLPAHGESNRDTQLVVVAKIKGADELEDDLDDLSDLIERAVITALHTDQRQCELRNTSVQIDGGGESRVGTLTMTFSVQAWLIEPLTD
ncbi:hypothetical protein UM399_11905 [Sulfitobacter pontiacus]|uniref:hypothetical protein n=1 Tax=Sulfitobacter pontiacus TaxID=60137 RepID=UPI002AC9B385|nr:hypothetical protein [Sulfitobacter pontiacus]WPZ24867.1 hypothetical protein UM399_11905 [Sulfitobacter pontiacus]|tara:strand:+ start:72 stop:491 length:420 start_codon:yes stop_codon:yes gene_type:complete